MMMRIPRKLALLTGLAIALGGMAYALPAAAQVSVGVDIGVAPPPPRFERVPPPRDGWVWVPGYWRWDPRWHHHVWVHGYWVQARPGFRYVPPGWAHGPHGHWHFRGGYWAR